VEEPTIHVSKRGWKVILRFEIEIETATTALLFVVGTTFSKQKCDHSISFQTRHPSVRSQSCDCGLSEKKS
jgi:hypothetical protein